MMAKLGKKVRALREGAVLSQVELALILGLSPKSKGFISEVESGKKLPSLAFVLRIAERFDVTTDYLLRDDLPLQGAAAADPSSNL